jgi:hypothetical protein
VPADNRPSVKLDSYLDRICSECGLTFGSHHGTYEWCPGHEDRMDWDENPGKVRFIDSGQLAHVPYGTPARRQTADS